MGDVPSSHEGPPVLRGWSGSQRAWTVSLVLSAALIVLLEIGKRHYAAHTLNGRIGAGILLWLITSLIVRGLLFVLIPSWRRDRQSAASRGTAASGGHPRSDGHRATRPWGIRYAVGALLLVWVAAIPIALLLDAGGIVHLPPGVSTLIGEGLFLCALIPLWRSGRLRAIDIGLRPLGVGSALGAAVAGYFGYGLLAGIYATAVRPPAAHSHLAGLAHHTVFAIVVAAFASIIVAPFCEELFFRGLIYGALRNRLSVAPAALIVGVIFGLGHTQYPLLVRPELAILGVVLCVMYEQTGSLLPGMALHSFNNAVAVDLVLGGSAWLAILIYVGLAAVLLLGTRTARSRRRLTSGPPPAREGV